MRVGLIHYGLDPHGRWIIMRVGIIVYGLDRPLTGIGRYTLELIRALSDLKPCPEIVLLSAGDLGPLSGVPNIPKVPLTGARLLPSLMTWGQIIIEQRARELKVDVIHDTTGTAPLAFAKQRRATVSTIHDVFAFSLPGYSSLLDKLIYKHWLTRGSARTDAIITVSSQSCIDISRYLKAKPERIQIIPYGVSNLFHPLANEIVEPIVRDRFNIRQPYILYVGALTERKNLTRVLQAFSKIRQRSSKYKLVLVGPRSWKQSPIERTVVDLNLSKHVQLTGPVTDNELPALYNGASLFVFPSLYEGFGLPVLEAMACGAPVVTSNTSSLPEVAGDAAVLVDPTNVEQIAEAMWLVLSQPALAAALREKGLARAAQFTWERTARETVAVYERVMERNRKAHG